MTFRYGILNAGMRSAGLYDVPHKDYFMAAVADGFRVIDRTGRTGAEYPLLPAPLNMPTITGTFHFDYNRIARKIIGNNGTNIILIDFDRWEFVKNGISTPAGLNCIRISNTGRFFVLCSSGSGVRVYDTLTMSEVATVQTGLTPTWASWSIDDKALVVSYLESPFVKIYTVDGWASWSNPATLPAGPAHSCAYSPRMNLMAVGHENSPYVTIYDMPGYVKRVNPCGNGLCSLPTGTVLLVRFTPDGNGFFFSQNGSNGGYDTATFQYTYGNWPWQSYNSVDMLDFGETGYGYVSQGGIKMYNTFYPFTEWTLDWMYGYKAMYSRYAIGG